MKKSLLIATAVWSFLLLCGCASFVLPKDTPNPTLPPLPVVTLTLPPVIDEEPAEPAPKPTPRPTGLLDGTAGKNDVHYNMTYDEAMAKNDDVIGYLTVAGTNIEYPVVRGEDNEFYRSHDIMGAQNKYGAVYMDSRNGDKAEQQHIIIYAHNMKDGTMFNGLINFKQKEFFDKNRIISFSRGGADTMWEIYLAAAIVNGDGVNLDHTKTTFGSGEEFSRYMDDIIAYARTQDGCRVTDTAGISTTDQVLTLATCTDEADGSHFIVQARRVR